MTETDEKITIVGTENVLPVRLPPELERRLQLLLQEESFGFSNMSHLVLSALWSFSGYKLRQLDNLRRDAEGLR
jgi:hypothetical protein